MKTISKFWCVWNIARSAPRYQHDSKSAAQDEAKRLARDCPGETFIVLAAVDAYPSPVQEPERIGLSKPSALDSDLDIPL
jgi:hypothetical protein